MKLFGIEIDVFKTDHGCGVNGVVFKCVTGWLHWNLNMGGYCSTFRKYHSSIHNGKVEGFSQQPWTVTTKWFAKATIRMAHCASLSSHPQTKHDCPHIHSKSCFLLRVEEIATAWPHAKQPSGSSRKNSQSDTRRLGPGCWSEGGTVARGFFCWKVTTT